MVDKDSMSVEEIVAYCQQTDGEGGGSAEAASAPAASEESSPAANPEASAPSAEAARSMSVEEMLAAARGEKGAGGGEAPAEETSAPAASAPSKPASEMSVEEMMAAARGEKAGGGKSSGASAAPAGSGSGGDKLDPSAARAMSMEDMLAAARGGGAKAEKPAKKPAAKKPAAKPGKAAPAAPAEPTGPRDTGSIFAERNPNKPGPKSKAEAAADTKAKPAKAEKQMPVMPEKPAYAAPRPSAPAAETEDRRGFFAAITGTVLGSSMAVGFASLTVTNLLWTLGLAKFMFPNILIEPPTKFKVGFPGEYAPGQVQTKFKAQFGVWIVRYEYEGAAQIYALKSVCTHLGCTPNWLEGEQKFKCPCHGSGFYKDGVNFEGPAPRPLERYAIRVADDGQLEVDKSQTFNEEKGQWADSSSFVKV